MRVRFVSLFLLAAVVAVTGCSSADDEKSPGGSSSGGSSSGGSSSGGSSSGGSSSGGSSSGGSSGTSQAPTEPAKKPMGAQCERSADCESDFCVFLSGGGSLGMCTQTCGDTIDCPGLDYECVALSDAPQKVCVPR